MVINNKKYGGINMQENSITGERDSLSPKQKEAIFLLLNPQLTRAEIAERLSIGERTLYAWLQDDKFQRELKVARSKLSEAAMENLKTSFENAVSKLNKLVNSDDERVSLKACELVINFNLKAKDQELDDRLSALEELFKKPNT
jgi:transposase-like protein